MISFTELLCGKICRSHQLRYEKPKNTINVRPVVVWNSTRRCNLTCAHCYATASNTSSKSELRTSEAKKMISDLKTFNVPCLLISGGEPLLRDDLQEILSHANEISLPVTISTNGTLIDDVYATMFRDYNVRYVGISLDGVAETHDRFRGMNGAFLKATNAFNFLNMNGIRSGLRLTITKNNIKELDDIFIFARDFQIERICFYHIVPVGRGKNLTDLIPSPDEIRNAIDRIMNWTAKLSNETEVLTVDNHADNIYVYLKSGRSDRVLSLIRNNGGAKLSSGVGIGCIDADGNIHPDQFWTDCTIGNIREHNFSEVWMSPENSLLAQLRQRTKYIKGRCGRCRWLELCGGGLRSRANAFYSDPWAEDPACYLSDEEIL